METSTSGRIASDATAGTSPPSPTRDPVDVVVRDAEDANKVVRRVIAIRRYADRVRGWAAVELRRAEARERWLLRLYGPKLEAWLSDQLSRHRRQRSVHLPAGRIGFRKMRPHIVVSGEAELVAWCRQHLPHALRTSVRAEGLEAEALMALQKTRFPEAKVDVMVAKDVLTDSVRQTGILPDGAQLVTGERFYIA